MEISVYGLILATKNLGIWLSQFEIAGIRADKPAFFYALLLYLLISVPSDLLLLNHATSKAEETAKTE